MKKQNIYISIAFKAKAVRASQSASQKAHETKESDSLKGLKMTQEKPTEAKEGSKGMVQPG